MATQLLLKSSTISNNVPTTSSLSLRELAINTTDGRLFFRKGTGSGGDSILEVVTLSETQTLSNKTLSNVTLTGTLNAGSSVGSAGAFLQSTESGVTWSTTISSSVLGNSSLFIGTTSIPLNRTSANLGLSGITGISFPGSTSGTITLQPTAIAGSNTVTLPASTGTLVTTGDSGSVTSTMIASNTIVNSNISSSAAIDGSKINPNFGAQNISTSGNVTATRYYGDGSFLTGVGGGGGINIGVLLASAYNMLLP